MNDVYHIFSSPQALAKQFATYFAEWILKNLRIKDYICIALSGGNTPQLWFTTLAQYYVNQINWERLHFFWVDERYVSYEHIESNYGIARKLLFDHVNIPLNHIHPIPVTGNIRRDVLTYCDELKRYVPLKNGWPVFDMMILGMGTDGHTASIFPNQLDLFHHHDVACISENPYIRQQRITLTGQVINHAENIYVLVTGSEKTQILNDVLHEIPGSEQYPIAYVRRENTFWWIDTSAAQMLENT